MCVRKINTREPKDYPSIIYCVLNITNLSPYIYLWKERSKWKYTFSKYDLIHFKSNSGFLYYPSCYLSTINIVYVPFFWGD